MKAVFKIVFVFLIVMFSMSLAYAENRIRRPPSDFNVIRHMKKHNPNKRPFHRRPIILDRQRDDANIYFISGNIMLAAIAYLTPKEIWQHIFIRVRSHNSKHNYIIGIQIKF